MFTTGNTLTEPVPTFHTYLTPEAKKIHDTEIKTLVYEVVVCPSGHETLKQPGIHCPVCSTTVGLCLHTQQIQFMSVRFTESLPFAMMASPIDDELRRRKIDAYALAMAGAFNLLVEKKLIAHGTLAKCFLLKCAISDLNAPYIMSVFVGARADKDELNAALVSGGYAPLFVSEGEEPSEFTTAKIASTIRRAVGASYERHKPTHVLTVTSKPAPDETVKKFKEAWNEQLKTHPPLAEHSTYDSVPLVLKTLAPTSTLTRVFKFLCYLNSQDHPVAEQREHIAVTRELKAILGEEAWAKVK